MDTQVDLRHTNVTGAWFQPLPPPQSHARACEVLADPSNEQLAALWNELISGRARVATEHSDKTHHYLELVPSLAASLPPRHLARWVPLLMGTSVKVVAADGGFASSTVAGSAAQCFQYLGLHRTSREAPMLLVMMAHAGVRFATSGVFGSKRFYSSVMIRVRRPDLALSSLSAAELDVIRLRVDGLSHREIAVTRSTSVRTIANQLASAYRKLGVSGRLELLAVLIKHASH